LNFSLRDFSFEQQPRAFSVVFISPNTISFSK